MEDAETLNRPEHEPGLAGVLTDVSRWEALDEIPDEELHVCILQQSWRGFAFGAVRYVFEQYVLSFRLGLGRRCREGIGKIRSYCHGGNKESATKQ